MLKKVNMRFLRDSLSMYTNWNFMEIFYRKDVAGSHRCISSMWFDEGTIEPSACEGDRVIDPEDAPALFAVLDLSTPLRLTGKGTEVHHMGKDELLHLLEAHEPRHTD